MILKQAVWQHKWPFNGVILSRNPLAIYASVATYRDPVKEASCRSLPASRNAFLEWMQRIAPEEYPHFKLLKPADQFCNFYNLRMQHLLDNTKNPIVNYETLVCSPNRVLNQILSLAGLSKSDNIAAPSNCPSSPVGHGGFDPTMPIREESITKYLRTLSPTDIRYIWSRTKEVAEAYGYRCKGLEIISTNTSRTLG